MTINRSSIGQQIMKPPMKKKEAFGRKKGVTKKMATLSAAGRKKGK